MWKDNIINISKYYCNKINSDNFINNNEHKNLYDKIKKINNSINIINNINIKLIDNLDIIKNGKYISNKIYNDIIKNYNNKYEIIYNNINLYYILDRKINSNDKKIIKICIRIILIMSKLLNNNNKIYINIYPTKHKKKLNNEFNILGPNEINSGYTLINPLPKPGKIYIYRKEELIRVLIHELLHAYHYDYNLYNEKNEEIYNLYNLYNKNNINSSESMVDKHAIIINCIYNSLRYDYKTFIEMLNYEKEFNKIQIAKILKYYNYSSINDIYRKNNKEKFKQNSNIISYFFTKFNDHKNIDKLIEKKYNNTLRLSLLEFKY